MKGNTNKVQEVPLFKHEFQHSAENLKHVEINMEIIFNSMRLYYNQW